MSKIDEYLALKERTKTIKNELDSFGINSQVKIEAINIDFGSFCLHFTGCGHNDPKGLAEALLDYIRSERCWIAEAAAKRVDRNLEHARLQAQAEVREILGGSEELKAEVTG